MQKLQIVLKYEHNIFVSDEIQQKLSRMFISGIERKQNCLRVLLPSQKKGHYRIQKLSQKTSHFTLFRKWMCMQESISAKYG